MELIYWTEFEHDNVTEGLLLKCNQQQLDEINLINLCESNRNEFSESFNIDITLSTSEGLSNRKIELRRNQS